MSMSKPNLFNNQIIMLMQQDLYQTFGRYTQLRISNKTSAFSESMRGVFETSEKKHES